MLDFVDKAFDQVPLFVQVLVIFTLLFAIRARRNDRLCAVGLNQIDQRCQSIDFLLHQIIFRRIKTYIKHLHYLPTQRT
jgi:hypothetical protein